MFIYNNKEYEKVWFSSDEHYGSSRHLEFSKRLDYHENTEKEKRIREFKTELEKENTPESIKKALIRNLAMSHYGGIATLPVSRMDAEITRKHNSRVCSNDLVFHLGDFGNFEQVSQLDGDHILIMGNYEYDECKKSYDDDINKYADMIKSKYKFIDVLPNYRISVTNDNLFSPISKDVFDLFITHKPEDCIWLTDPETGHNIPEHVEADRVTMNLFGHIHDKGKVKRFGLNVGIDCNHYYPVSQEEVCFYISAILHHYDENVFM